MIRKHFRLKRIALGLALATAVVAPTAQAAVYVDGPTPGVQAGYIRAASHQKIASEMSVQSPVSQLKVEGMRWMAMANQYYRNRPGITAAGAALANQKHSAYPVPTTQVSTTSVSDGFNWSDAGIGASISFGAALLLLTAVGLGRRSRSRGLASV
ncbi:MAG TPA: hypothetical protein VK532_04950, partial [Gaiellaceae bacterium]|jgi:hypothetical protein|nr:hypothetical protein [Gaiellaceae bacterium]